MLVTLGPSDRKRKTARRIRPAVLLIVFLGAESRDCEGTYVKIR
jgi:hypothetical protein